MLTHWRLCGALQQLAGIGFGSFEGWQEADGRAEEPAHHRFDLDQVLRERSLDLGIPVVAHLPVGHSPGNAALPLGVMARLDGGRGHLGLLGPGVR
jgi:muramoyltetrapeptide carboxypeptidase